MQISQLRAFQAVAETGGFSKAAVSLHLTQPAVSDHVRRLEQEFGVTLFHRSGRSVELTELGRRLLIATRQLFGYERHARDILSAASMLTSGVLTLVADAPDLAVQLSAAFRARYPGVMVSLSIANAEVCIERVLSNVADAAVTAAPQIDSRIRSQVLRREPLMALVPAGNVLARRRQITFEDLIQHPLISREARSVTQRLFESELERHALRAEPSMRVEGREALLQAVAHGIGVGVIARAEFSGDPRCRVIPLVDCHAEMVESLVCLTDRPPSRLIDALFDIGTPVGETI